MSVGYRYFVFTRDEAIPLTRKAFEGFFFRDEPTLKVYADQTINIAVVTCRLENRKPNQIVVIDTMRFAVDGNGMPAREFMIRYNRFIANRIDPHPRFSGKESPVMSQNVVDAVLKFNQREWDTFKPKLPGPVHKQILDRLFP